MSNEKFDVAILGGGPGGYVAAIKAAQHGLKTALIEKGFLGGTCLNVGCIPTKALLASAEVYREAQHAADFGVKCEGVSYDFTKIMSRKERVVKQLRGGVELLMKKHCITVYSGAGQLIDANTLGVAVDGGMEVKADSIILATGSVPACPPIPGCGGANVINSDQILSWPDVPKSLTVIGGGAVGLEFAYFFNTLGTKVTLLEALPQILPAEDTQIAAELTSALKRQRINIFTGACVQEIADADGGKVTRFSYNDENKEVASEVVLIATGRWPFSTGAGLVEQGIEFAGRAVKVDEYLHTGVGEIYAIGDLIGGMQLAHKASMEATVAVNNILGKNIKVDRHAIPTAMYADPGVASVGMTEANAVAAGITVKVGSFPFRALGKSQAIGAREGFAKVVINAETDVVIGAQAIGHGVTDLIADATVAVQHNLTAAQWEQVIHPHPTLSEVFQEALEVAQGHALHI